MEIAIAIAIAVVALAGWDIGRRYLAGHKADEQAAFKAAVDDLESVNVKLRVHDEQLARHERQLTDIKGTQVQSTGRRAPQLTGVSR